LKKTLPSEKGEAFISRIPAREKGQQKTSGKKKSSPLPTSGGKNPIHSPRKVYDPDGSKKGGKEEAWTNFERLRGKISWRETAFLRGGGGKNTQSSGKKRKCGLL